MKYLYVNINGMILIHFGNYVKTFILSIYMLLASILMLAFRNTFLYLDELEHSIIISGMIEEEMTIIIVHHETTIDAMTEMIDVVTEMTGVVTEMTDIVEMIVIDDPLKRKLLSCYLYKC